MEVSEIMSQKSIFIFQQSKTMCNLDTITSKNDNKKWRYRMLITGPSGSGKTNPLLNLIQQGNNHFIDKIYLYTKGLSEPKYQLLI